LYNLSPDYKIIDPCTNFEELVCGGWRDRHDLREDQGDAFTGTIMAENSQLLLKHILEAPYPKDSMVRRIIFYEFRLTYHFSIHISHRGNWQSRAVQRTKTTSTK